MMKIKTKYFGEIEIEEENIIDFFQGIPGFEELKKFVLLDIPDQNNFKCLQSIEEEVAFLLINPWEFFSNYEFDLSDMELGELDIKKEKQMIIYNILTIPNDPKKMSANLLAPIVINVDAMKAKQVILYNSSYGTKHYILEDGAISHACTD